MKSQFTYWQDDGFRLGYLSDYPDCMTLGETPSELKENMKDLYRYLLVRDVFRTVLLILFLLLCPGTQVATGSSFSDGFADKSPEHSRVPVHTDLQVLEREWHQIPDGPTVEMSIEHLRKMGDAARQLIVLTINGADYRAESVYFTDQPEGFTCRLMVADDTAHTTEFPLTQVPIPYQAGITYQLRRSRPLNLPAQQRHEPGEVPTAAGDSRAPAMYPAWPMTYTADPAEMHGATFSVEIHQPDSTGRFQPKLRRTDRQQLLFLIIKEPDTEFYRKYVWVIEAASNGKGMPESTPR